MKRIALAILFALVVTGCSSQRLQDGYQPGDLTGAALDGTVQVLTLQHRYCTESDPVARALLLHAIRSAIPGYPAEGLCTDLLDLMGTE